MDDLNSLIAHAHRRIDQLNRELAEQRVREQIHIESALEQQKLEHQRALEQAVATSLEHNREQMRLEQEKKVGEKPEHSHYNYTSVVPEYLDFFFVALCSGCLFFPQKAPSINVSKGLYSHQETLPVWSKNLLHFGWLPEYNIDTFLNFCQNHPTKYFSYFFVIPGKFGIMILVIILRRSAMDFNPFPYAPCLIMCAVCCIVLLPKLI